MNLTVDWDNRLFIFLNNLGSKPYDKFWLFLTNEYYWIPLYILVYIIIIEIFGWKKALIIGVLIALMVACADTFANIVKYSVKRYRPCKNPELQGLFRLVIEKCRGNYCFFSAHAANSFALATFLNRLLKEKFKYAPYLLFLWAGLMSYSRIYVGVHFPGDIIIGAFIGIIIGYLFFQLLEKISFYFEKKN